MKSTANAALKSLLTPIALGLLVPLSASVYVGCKKDEPPPPLPSAEPEPAPSAPLTLVVEDAGDDGDAADDADAAKKKGTGAPAASLTRCCQAMSQNAENAPEPTKTYMKQLAASCFAAAKQGQAAQVSALARQAGVACK
jgi:hypothetical protein